MRIIQKNYEKHLAYNNDSNIFQQLPTYANVTGYSQEGGPKQGFVMGPRTQGVQEILEKYI